MKFIHVLTAAALVSLLACAGGNGSPGATGPQGAMGPTGPAGAAGPAGQTGATGAPGPKGDTGAAGVNGTNGINGTNGTNGTNGSPGAPGAPGNSVHVLDGNNVAIGYPVGVTQGVGINLWDDADDVIWPIDVNSGAYSGNIATVYYFDSACSQLALQGVSNGFGTLARQPLRGAPQLAMVARGLAHAVSTIYQNSDTGCLMTNLDSPENFTGAVILSTLPSYTPPVHIGFLPTR